MSDLISRQAAIDTIKDADVCVFYSDNQSIDDVIDYTIRATKGSVIASIEQLPSAQPERKKGKWLEMAGDLQCSECGAIYYDLYPDYSDTKFCPNCGADMR